MIINKQYTINLKEQREFYARVRRESRLWKKTLWLRISIWAIIPVMYLICADNNYFFCEGGVVIGTLFRVCGGPDTARGVF